MTQPDNPVPARGARPQLFGVSKASSRSRQPDFGPSILATIDGAPRHAARARDAVSGKRLLGMAGLALGAVLVYFVVKLGLVPAVSVAPKAAPVWSPAVAPPVGTVIEAAPPVVAGATSATAAPATTGAASIESVSVPVTSGAPAAADKPVPSKGVVTPQEAPSARAVTPATKTAAKSAHDSDADLLAAMLPHIKRRATASTSPAYEKRCGALAGDAALDCRARFCVGRDGTDAACPASVPR